MTKSYDECKVEASKLIVPRDNSNLLYTKELTEYDKVYANVNKPSHYTYGKYECIDVIKDITEGNGAKGIEAFCLGNVLKYLWRYKHKNGTEDLKKAMWYLERLIKESK